MWIRSNVSIVCSTCIHFLDCPVCIHCLHVISCPAYMIRNEQREYNIDCLVCVHCLHCPACLYLALLWLRHLLYVSAFHNIMTAFHNEFHEQAYDVQLFLMTATLYDSSRWLSCVCYLNDERIYIYCYVHCLRIYIGIAITFITAWYSWQRIYVLLNT